MQPTQNTATLAKHPDGAAVARCGECGAPNPFNSPCRNIAAPTLTATVVTPAVTLRAAARYLVRHGWVQGAYYDVTASVFTPAACMVGAIGSVCFGGPVDAPAEHFGDPGYSDFEQAVTYLDRCLTDWHGVVSYEFNDATGRIITDVLCALHDAAAQWDRLQGGAA